MCNAPYAVGPHIEIAVPTEGPRDNAPSVVWHVNYTDDRLCQKRYDWNMADQGKRVIGAEELAVGEYRWPDSASDAARRQDVRTLLDRISDLEPRVLNELHDDVFPAFRECALVQRLWGKPKVVEEMTERAASIDKRRRRGRGKKPGVSVPPLAPEVGRWDPSTTTGHTRATRYLLEWLLDWEWLKALRIRDRAFRDFKTRLTEWGASASILDDWFFTIALRTLQLWTDSEEDAEERTWMMPGRWTTSLRTSPGAALTFTYPKWEAEFQRMGAYKDAVRAALEDELDRHVQETRKAFADAGYERSTYKRGRARKGNPDQHFDWLVLYQFSGRSFQEVCDHHTITAEPRGRGEHPPNDEVVSTSAVKKGIRTLADRLSLTLRPEN